MNAPYICLLCSRNLLRWRCQRRSSGYVSLGQLVGRDGDSRTTPREVPLANGESATTSPLRRKKPLTFAQKYQEQRKPRGVDKVLETLFASNRDNELSRTLKDQPVQTAAAENSAIKRSIGDRLWELRNKLLRGTAPLQQIWTDCESLMGENKWVRKDAMINGGEKMLPDYSSTSLDTPANLRTLRDILLAICQKQRFKIDLRDFTPADAIKTYMKYGVMRNWWNEVLWCQLGNVLQLKYQSTDATLGAASADKIRVLLCEILDVWSVYMGRYGYSGKVSVPLSRYPNTVNDETSTLDRFSSSSEKPQRTKSTDEITVAAVMTLECLTAAEMRAPVQLMSRFSRFGQAMERNRSIATRCLLHAEVSSEITEKALEGWESQSSPKPQEMREPTEKANKSRASKYPISASPKRHDRVWSQKELRERLANIDGAEKRSDTRYALILWHQFQAHLEADKPEDETDLTSKLYARFLRVFWALRHHEHAIEVWNHMVNSGHLPDQHHWTAMLTGCIRAKDIESLERIWTNMVRSDMPLDTNAWTTYIYGLIECRKWETGLNALEHLGRIWKLAPPLKSSDTAADKTTENDTADENQNTEKPKEDAILRPTLAPINAALSALIHINKLYVLPRVLAWAQSYQIPLSATTFNILLRPLVRHGSQASIKAHLQQMADANCVPDVVTFTIILNGLVSNPTSTFHTLTPEAQESTITSILADMARQGIEPDPLTYGTLLDGLLTPGIKGLTQNFEPNVPAARTILAHMAARNIHPSPHIYTILVVYYFTRLPPDLPAISSLWSSINHSGQTNRLDHVFFDRLIEGYADHDEIEDSLKFLRMMPERWKSPGWKALLKLLRALVRGREWGWCGELVEDVEREGGLLRHGQGRGQGRDKAEFWELVEEVRGGGFLGKVNEER